MNKNNLFSFATGELSQDAFICWCANWVNFKDDKSGLYDMGKEFIKLVSHIENAESVEILTQYKKIDILLIIDKKTAVIIEDKTFTGEHDNQIEKYKKILKKEIENGRLNIDKQDYRIITTFFKTGEYYPGDHKTALFTDIKIKREDVINLLGKYVLKSEIVRDYYERLLYLSDWYSEYNGYYRNGEYAKAFCENWGQYCFVNDLFGGKKMLGQFLDKEVIIESSNSHGKPYSWAWLWGKDDWYWLGYKVDSDENGYFVSLRQYRSYKKSADKELILKEKKKMFEELKSAFKAEMSLRKIEDYALGGNNASFNESEIGKFYFEKTDINIIKNNLYGIAEKLIGMIETMDLM